jgi:putative two-component system response regulator
MAVLIDSAEEVIHALAAAVEARDPYTQAHAQRVADSARRIGQAMRLSTEDQEALYRGGLVHDVGKIGVPDEILLKPGALDEQQLTRMKLHPLIGESIVAPLRTGIELRAMVRNHHERYDGTGYPDRLAHNEIPFLARILSVCDAYDAIVNDRPYRERFSSEEAVRMLLEGAGRQWDPEVVHFVVVDARNRSQKATA